MDTPVAAEMDSTESAVIETDLGIEADVNAGGGSDEPIDSPADGLSL